MTKFSNVSAGAGDIEANRSDAAAKGAHPKAARMAGAPKSFVLMVIRSLYLKKSADPFKGVARKTVMEEERGLVKCA
ncbi:MAG: hypothetical protein ACLP4V_00590 [Methylocella sp.]